MSLATSYSYSMPPSSPINHESNTEWPTPVRKKIRTFRYDCSMTYRAIESVTGVPDRTIRDICNAFSLRRGANNSEIKKRRGRKSVISSKDTREMKKILEADGFNTRALRWEQLGYEARLDVSSRTIRRHMGTMEYHKCLACRKGWCNEKIKAKRVEVCEIWKERYPQKEDWHSVWFSDECHCGFGPQGSLRIIRKPGERYCHDCIQEADPKGDGSKKGQQKRQHTWASAGHNFKSDLIYYDVPGNSNGKMSHRVYIDSILEHVVKPWLSDVKQGRIDPFVLEEDGDSGHGGGSKRNPVRVWKEEMDWNRISIVPRHQISVLLKIFGKHRSKLLEKYLIGTIPRWELLSMTVGVMYQWIL